MLDGNRRQCARHEAAAFFLSAARIEMRFPSLTHGRLFVHEGARHTEYEIRPGKNLIGIGREGRMRAQHRFTALPVPEKSDDSASSVRRSTAQNLLVQSLRSRKTFCCTLGLSFHIGA